MTTIPVSEKQIEELREFGMALVDLTAPPREWAKPVEEVARAIYEDRNGFGCTPWRRQGAEMKRAYRKDAQAAINKLRSLGFVNIQCLDALKAEGTHSPLKAEQSPSSKQETRMRGASPST